MLQNAEDDKQSISCVKDPKEQKERKEQATGAGVHSQEKLATMSDEAIVRLVQSGDIPPHALEERLGNLTRAVRIRRTLLSNDLYPLFSFLFN